MIETCLDKAVDLLTKNKAKLKKLAETLVAKETLDDVEIRELLNLPKRNGSKSRQ